MRVSTQTTGTRRSESITRQLTRRNLHIHVGKDTDSREIRHLDQSSKYHKLRLVDCSEANYRSSRYDEVVSPVQPRLT